MKTSSERTSAARRPSRGARRFTALAALCFLAPAAFGQAPAPGGAFPPIDAPCYQVNLPIERCFPGEEHQGWREVSSAAEALAVGVELERLFDENYAKIRSLRYAREGFSYMMDGAGSARPFVSNVTSASLRDDGAATEESAGVFLRMESRRFIDPWAANRLSYDESMTSQNPSVGWTICDGASLLSGYSTGPRLRRLDQERVEFVGASGTELDPGDVVLFEERRPGEFAAMRQTALEVGSPFGQFARQGGGATIVRTTIGYRREPGDPPTGFKMYLKDDLVLYAILIHDNRVPGHELHRPREYLFDRKTGQLISQQYDQDMLRNWYWAERWSYAAIPAEDGVEVLLPVRRGGSLQWTYHGVNERALEARYPFSLDALASDTGVKMAVVDFAAYRANAPRLEELARQRRWGSKTAFKLDDGVLPFLSPIWGPAVNSRHYFIAAEEAWRAHANAMTAPRQAILGIDAFNDHAHASNSRLWQ